jgi:hypothetical protein
MVPSGLGGLSGAAATVAGSLIGLLFVAVTLRYDRILGGTAPHRNRAVAGSAFTALANALAVSLWALIPSVNIGVPGTAAALVCLSATVRTHRGPQGRSASSRVLFALSSAVYLYQLGASLFVLEHPGNLQVVYSFAYIVFAALAAALSRSWQLLQDEGPAVPATGALPPGARRARRQRLTGLPPLAGRPPAADDE